MKLKLRTLTCIQIQSYFLANMSSMNFQKYQAQREALIAEDRSQRVDRQDKPSPAELKADEVIRNIRDEEAASIWSAKHEDIEHPFPGMEFLTGRRLIVQTRLFKILNKMPKGALLHAHLDGMVNPEFLLKLAMTHDAFHVKAAQPVNIDTIKDTLPVFKPLPLSEFTEGISLTSPDYQPDSWVSLSKARESFAPELGGPEGFDRWVVSSLTINPNEAYKTHNTVPKIWQKFQSTFLTSTGLIRYAPVWRAYIREFFLSSIEDGISYIETRINFLYRFMWGVDGQENVPHREWLLIVDEVIQEVKNELKSQGREDEFIGARIIYSTIRFITPEELEWYLNDCIALKKEFPHLIAGFDLVGDENALKPLIYYAENLLRFQERVKDLRLDIPFIFHAGETLGDGTEADQNLYDAILLGTKRIGHGFSLVKHPRLIEICKKRDILIEVCPISNEILRLTSSMPMHPLPIMINNGLPVALCSDDPAVFGNMGLSFDYFQVLVASEVTGLTTLGRIALDSLKHSTLDGQEKQRAIDLWQRRWDNFVEEVGTTAA